MEISEFQEVTLRPGLEIGTMRGLFDIFGGHFAVLTKFLRNGLNSRIIGQEAAF